MYNVCMYIHDIYICVCVYTVSLSIYIHYVSTYLCLVGASPGEDGHVGHVHRLEEAVPQVRILDLILHAQKREGGGGGHRVSRVALEKAIHATHTIYRGASWHHTATLL